MGWPIVIEAEVGNHHQAEVEAISRLNRRVASTGREVHASVALVYPQALRNHQGQALRKALGEASFEYALYAAEKGGSESRFPESGWISGDIADLSLLLHRSSMPAWRVDALADSLERGVVRASGRFTASHAKGSPLGKEIAEILGQSDDDEGQTRRMAMTVVLDALVFHAALSKAEMGVQATPERTVRGPTQFREHGTFLPSQVIGRVGPHPAGQLLADFPYVPRDHQVAADGAGRRSAQAPLGDGGEADRRRRDDFA